MHPTPLRLAVAAGAVLAQSTPQAVRGDAVLPAAKGDEAQGKTIQRVEVKGAAANYDPRRGDTASKTVLSAQEIRKYGDDNIFDVLKRAPGVTVTDTVRAGINLDLKM